MYQDKSYNEILITNYRHRPKIVLAIFRIEKLNNKKINIGIMVIIIKNLKFSSGIKKIK